MERIQLLRLRLQNIVDSPRAPVMWGVMLCICTIIFCAQVVGASYVFTTVRIGMDGQKTQQEKKVDEEVLLMYDSKEHQDIRDFITARIKEFDQQMQKMEPAEDLVQAQPESFADVPPKPSTQTTPEVEQKKNIR